MTELWRGKDHNGTRSMSVDARADGSFVIEGQDLGPGVAIFGPDFREYEWAWTVPADGVLEMVRLLGGKPGDSPVTLLRAWAQANAGQDPGNFLKKGGLTMGFWSRLGD